MKARGGGWRRGGADRFLNAAIATKAIPSRCYQPSTSSVSARQYCTVRVGSRRARVVRLLASTIVTQTPMRVVPSTRWRRTTAVERCSYRYCRFNRHFSPGLFFAGEVKPHGSGRVDPRKKLRYVDFTRTDPRHFKSHLTRPSPTRENEETVDPTRHILIDP